MLKSNIFLLDIFILSTGKQSIKLSWREIIGLLIVFMRENNRLLWPDICKTIGLYLMVLGHVGLYGADNVIQLIYSFHMPLFFIMSGIFFKQGNLKKTT